VSTRKYAKWKAAYINNCLKNGEIPQAGPLGEEEDTNDQEGNYDLPQPPQNQEPNPIPHASTWSSFDPTKQPQSPTPSASSNPIPSSSFASGTNSEANPYSVDPEQGMKGTFYLFINETVF